MAGDFIDFFGVDFSRRTSIGTVNHGLLGLCDYYTISYFWFSLHSYTQKYFFVGFNCAM